MAKFVFPKCPHCGHKNSFDLEVLRRDQAVVYRRTGQSEEFRVICAQCGQPFVFKVKGESDG